MVELLFYIVYTHSHTEIQNNITYYYLGIIQTISSHII